MGKSTWVKLKGTADFSRGYENISGRLREFMFDCWWEKCCKLIRIDVTV